VNREIVRHGETGLLAETEEEWVEAIRDLLADAELRRRMGTEARKNARRLWSYEVWEQAFLEAVGA
jgi:glycosyltransferase involved in cell wall biosynthesis